MASSAQHRSKPENGPELLTEHGYNPQVLKHDPDIRGKPNSTWLYEFCGLGVATAALVAIYAVLHESHNRLKPDFSHGITLNTIISLLIEVFTLGVGVVLAAVAGQIKWNWFWTRPRRLDDFRIFDNVLGSPLGAVKMLATPRIASKSIVSVISVLTLLSLAVGPFSQQLLRYESRPVALDVASIPRSNMYDAHTAGAIVSQTNTDLAIKASFYNGMFNSAQPSLFAVQPACPTGNCTWPRFSSIGVCSRCTDTSSAITQICIDEGAPQSRVNICYWTIPGGPFLSHGQTVLNMTAFFPIQPIGFTPALPMEDTTLAHVQMLVNTGSIASPQTYALTCQLYFCIKTYQSSIESGILHEAVVATFPNASTPSVATKIVVKRPPKNQTSFGFAGAAYPNVTLVPDLDDGILGGNYSWVGMMANPLQMFLAGSLKGSATISVREQSYTSDAMQVMWGAFEGSQWNVSRMASTWESIATSLTNAIRVDPLSSGSTTEAGIASANQIFVSVRFEWISLPIVVLVLTGVALVVVIRQTRAAHLESFKGESLAVLFAGLKEAKRAELSVPVVTLEHMRTVAKRLQVKLQVSSKDGQYYLA